ncbi:MAG: hypothetical protein CVU07_03980 [Bacteroidetes bacterium HGW-Bacteroidetes-23]|uniref:DUF2089 domain-containing protein n=1 Tax=Flavobacterium azooxidireducens TaxID=1871076 RepID=A0ABY4KDA1_9FLAO|nr:DUF2089 family protein [Flavobacterium azooxidireducens]PKP17503.1 MAG: hypothetical protein CVU07_03980 [Bacteroidetes bacterium HGW-Bacteroidetes-23]UPQ78782.1 DUF2089 domain-containing protein [Flavobacterium azooxidireducens]
MKPKLPIHCPSCENSLSVSQLSCEHCKTLVSGNYGLPLLMQLSDEEQHFIMQFFLSSGSLKEMAIQMGNSYPTVRNKLDDIISKIKTLQNK